MRTLVYLYDQINTGLEWCASWVKEYPKMTVLVFVALVVVALVV